MTAACPSSPTIPTLMGMVGEEGHAWLSGVAENQLFTVVWGEQSCIIHLPERLEDTTKRLILPCH